MEMAFYRIQWSFVRRALAAFNFPQTWINLIMECISFPRFGLLVNGAKAQWINASCGLRQGCPLSPYLFILCSDFLSQLIRNSRHPGLGIKINASASKITHLLFVDDTLLFGTATAGTANEFSNILRSYCAQSGEAINASKSNIIFSHKVQSQAKEAILQVLGYKDVKSFYYLGIKLRPGKVRRAYYDEVLEKMACKLRCWGLRHLSMAGRVTLINSTLSAIPLHVLANSPMPLSIIKKIESLLKNFSGMVA
ncbi:hypothetical protein KSP39_PZI015833 [Platanthera zijinensis]|uniref:Reverse transcriptase domain-containing protein n=1 Tax=Platanthera zijinensis TaxID=2320716 RepID=A0AAP0B9V2_9ASPA